MAAVSSKMTAATSSMHVAIAKPLTFASREVSKSSFAVVSNGNRDASWTKLKSSCHISSTQAISQNVVISNCVKLNRMVTKAMSQSNDTKPLPGLPVDLRG